MFVNILKRGETSRSATSSCLPMPRRDSQRRSSRAGGQVREFLNRAVNALTGCRELSHGVKGKGWSPPEVHAFLDVLDATLATRSRH